MPDSKKKQTKAAASPAAKSAKPAKQKGKPAQVAPEQPAARKAKEKASKEKPKKAKLVRDSFTMPENEYQAIGDIKKACIEAGFAIKKSEVLRIGVALLQKMPAAQIRQALSALPELKAGRPKKDEAEAVASAAQ